MPLEWDEPDFVAERAWWTLWIIGKRLDDAGDPGKGMGRNARSLAKAAGKAGL